MRNVYIASAAVFITLAGASASAAPLLSDSGFEDTSIYPAASTSDGFLYPQATFGAWTYTGGVDDGAGLVDATKQTSTGFLAFGAPTGYGGSQYAFLQSVGTISQTFVTSSGGALSINWLEAGRTPHSPYGGAEDYTVEIDGVSVGSFKSGDSENFTAESLTTGSLTAGSHTLTFVGGSDPDQTAFLDNVTAVSAVPEPETWALMLSGVSLVGSLLRRRKARAKAGAPASAARCLYQL